MEVNTPGCGAGAPDCLCLLGAVKGQWCQAVQGVELGVQVGSSKGTRAQKRLCIAAFYLNLGVF